MKLIFALIAATMALTAPAFARHLHHTRTPADVVVEPSRTTVPVYRPLPPGFVRGFRVMK
jgi:hypothetical protein